MLAAVLGLVVGLVIGGFGAGGGVLTVPALVYVLGLSAQDATTGSVIIVGLTALAGVLARVREGGVDGRTGTAFGIVGIPAAALGALLNRHVAEPALLLCFAVLTIAAAAAMLLGSAGRADAELPGGGGVAVATRTRTRLRKVVEVAVCGLVIGFLTGFLGVGGGFLVVPALVLVIGMPMELAVGTSLLIVAMNAVSSLLARAGDLHLDGRVLVPFTLAAIAAGLVGKRLAGRLSGATLNRAFAVMLVVVGLAVGVESLLAA